MNLSTRLALAMTALVAVTASAVGILSYRNLEQSFLPRAMDRAQSHSRELAADIVLYTRNAGSDLLGFRPSVALEGIVRARLNGGVDSASGVPEAFWQQRLARRYLDTLKSKPEYSQIRLIGIAQGGREILRVDRMGPGNIARVVPENELQPQGDQEYFKETISLTAGEIHVSPPNLNRERGAVETPVVPTLRVATPIHAANGQTFGILVFNLDLRAVFDLIRAETRPGGSLYVVNERGDYLVHPDRRREFGFEYGSSFRWQDDFPDFASAAVSQSSLAYRTLDAAGESGVAGYSSARLAGGPTVGVIETIPRAVFMAPALAIQQSTLLAGAAFVVFGTLLAILIARSMTKPLVQVTRAIEQFNGNATLAIPEHALGEIGALSRAFGRMAAEVREKSAALKRESEQRSRIFDTSLDLIFVVDQQGIFLQVSPSSADILGRSPGAMIGRSIADYIHPDDLEKTRSEMQAASQGRRTHLFDCRYIHANGRIALLQWTGAWSEAERQHFLIGRDVTEVRLSEEKFRLAVEASPSGMVMSDAAGSIVLANAEAERLFGYRTGQLNGQSVHILVPHALRHQHVQDHATFFANPAVRRMGGDRDVFGLRKDGTEFPIEVGLNPIQAPHGPLVLSVIVDTTQRRAAEGAIGRLAEQEQILIAALDSSHDAFITKTLDGVITAWNQGAERLFGYSAEYAVGKSIELIIPENLRDEEKVILARLRNGEAIKHFETVRIGKDQRRIDMSLSVSPVRSASGAIIGAAKVARDITEAKRSQEALEQEIEQRRYLFDILSNTIVSMVDAVLVADKNGRILHSNPAAVRLIGFSAGTTPAMVTGVDDVFESDGVTLIPREQRPLRRAVRGEQISNVEIVVNRKSQSKSYHLVANGGPIRDNANQIVGAVIVYRDATNAKELERQLLQSQKMESIGQLTGGVAHDFNNILTVITGTIEILAEAVADQPNLAAVAKMIDDAAVRGAEPTQRLLAFARKQPLPTSHIFRRFLYISSSTYVLAFTQIAHCISGHEASRVYGT